MTAKEIPKPGAASAVIAVFIVAIMLTAEPLPVVIPLAVMFVVIVVVVVVVLIMVAVTEAAVVPLGRASTEPARQE